MREIFEKLDRWMSERNSEDGPGVGKCDFKILGQGALFEANLDLALFQTADVDAYTNASHEVLEKLNELLEPHGKHYDLFSKEIWMPDETTYFPLCEGQYVSVAVADPEYVMVSKAKCALEKNRALLVEYLAKEPSELFFELLAKYNVNADEIVA